MYQSPDMNANANNTARKTSKSQLNEACDRFFWFLGYVTGGTREETFKQAPGAIADLEAKAALVTALAANPAKLCAADGWLMERAASIPARLEWYRETYVNGNTIEKKEDAKLEAMLKAASLIMGCEVGEILAGGDTLTPAPENVIFHSFR